MGGENFYHDEPLFGLDIGHSTLKAMQIDTSSDQKPKVTGYGMAKFPSDVKMRGVITNTEVLAKQIYDLFKDGLVGEINTRRVACTLPTSQSFSRLMKLPEMADEDISEAIHLEAEQYIPMPLKDLYIDYEVSTRDASGIELLMVATPRSIVDSYVKFLESIDLEPVALEPSMNATTRAYHSTDVMRDEPSILIDFGAVSIDLAVYDKTMIVNSTLAGGSELMTKLISESLKVSPEEAYDIKSKYGVGASEMQQKVNRAIEPVLDELSKEVRKILRYYADRVGQSSKRQITHVKTSGGGATMPGINQLLSKEFALPTEVINPWATLDFGNLKLPSEMHKSAYVTVAGEAMLKPSEIFA